MIVKFEDLRNLEKSKKKMNENLLLNCADRIMRFSLNEPIPVHLNELQVSLNTSISF